MFADNLNSWELGLAPSPMSFAINAKEQEDVTDIFTVIEEDQKDSSNNNNAVVMAPPPPLELDIFEQELKRQEQVASINIQEDLLISNSQEQKPVFITNSNAEDNSVVTIDPKMTFLDDSGLEMDATGHVEDTQNLIEEMESFLLQHEQTNNSVVKKEEEFVVVASGDDVNNDSGLDLLEQVMEEVEMMPVVEEKEEEPKEQLTAEESHQAEAILDALIKGTLDAEFAPPSEQEMIVEETATTITKRDPVKQSPPVFSGINNISEVVTADGQKIVIVIANDMPKEKKDAAVTSIKAQVAATLPNRSPMPYEEEEDSNSDSDWTPYSPAVPNKRPAAKSTSVVKPKGGVSVGRVAKQRGPYSKRAHASVKDKKERKKLQNVEAARRYRDKKKLEQNVVEGEEEMLADKNKRLRGKVSEMENELKTLKKLMTELGLVK